MSMRWRVAGSVLAVIVFVDILLNPGRFLPVPPVVEAAAGAVSAFIAVWLYEGVFIEAGRVWRNLRKLAVTAGSPVGRPGPDAPS